MRKNPESIGFRISVDVDQDIGLLPTQQSGNLGFIHCPRIDEFLHTRPNSIANIASVIAPDSDRGDLETGTVVLLKKSRHQESRWMLMEIR